MRMRSRVIWAAGAGASIMLAAGCAEEGEAVEEARGPAVQEQATEPSEQTSETAPEQAPEKASGQEPNITQASADSSDEVGVKQLKLQVTGMGCGGCEISIQDAVAKIPGVAACQASFADGTATVELGDQPASRDEIVAAIEDLGFGVPEGESEEQEAPQT